MARKPTPQPEASPVTVQLGLDAALGDGSTEKPDLQLLNLDAIKGIPDKPDPKYTAETWPAYVESCRSGLEEPVKVSPNGDGTYQVKEGRHRCLAYKLLRMQQIPGIIRSDWVDDTLAALGEWKLNNMRAAPTPYEQANVLQRLIKPKDQGGKGWSIAEAAAKASVSEAVARNRLALVGPGFPEHIARRIGVDLTLDCADPFVQLAPQASYLLAAVADIKIPPSQSAWQVQRAVTETLCKQKLLFPVSLDHEDRQKMGGYENKTYEKRAKQLPLVTIGNTAYTTDGAKLKEIIDDEVAKWREKQKKNAVAEKASAGPKKRGPTVDARARVRMPEAQRGLAAKRVKGLVAWNDDLQCALAQTFLERNFDDAVRNDADEMALAEALGIDAKKVSPLRPVLSDAEKFKAYWKKERAQADKLLLWVLFASNRTTDHIQYGAASKSAQILGDDAWCKLLTGKTERDTFAALKEEVRAELDAKGKKPASKLTPAQRKAAEKAGAKRVRKQQAEAVPDPADGDSQSEGEDDVGTDPGDQDHGATDEQGA